MDKFESEPTRLPRGLVDAWIINVYRVFLSVSSTASGSSDPEATVALAIWHFFSCSLYFLSMFSFRFFPSNLTVSGPLPYLILAVPVCICSGKHSCVSSSFSTAIFWMVLVFFERRNSPCFGRSFTYKKHKYINNYSFSFNLLPLFIRLILRLLFPCASERTGEYSWVNSTFSTDTWMHVLSSNTVENSGSGELLN